MARAALRAMLDKHLRRPGPQAPPPAPPAAPSHVYPAIAELLRRRETAGTPASVDLAPYELKVFSQNGEDGVLDEILRRIGVQDRTFVEFGAGPGVEAVAVYLADVDRWHGHFIEADPADFQALAAKYAMSSRVTTTEAFVTPDEVEALFSRLAVPDEPDLLSIDIDGHDYWVWKAISRCRPRVVVIEYNAHLGTDRLTMPRTSTPGWQGTDYFGASIGALVDLGTEKGYRLVHCDLTGVNAFFVRDDLGGEFLPADEIPLRAPNYLLQGVRHPPGTGPWESV